MEDEQMKEDVKRAVATRSASKSATRRKAENYSAISNILAGAFDDNIDDLEDRAHLPQSVNFSDANVSQ